MTCGIVARHPDQPVPTLAEVNRDLLALGDRIAAIQADMSAAARVLEDAREALRRAAAREEEGR